MRHTLVWKYAAYFATLVSALLIISGAVGGYFAYRESLAALEEVQRTKAQFAALEIANFMRSVRGAIRATVSKFSTADAVATQDLRMESAVLLRQHPEISELRWISANGEEQLVLSRFGLDPADKGRNWSHDPRFVAARETSNHVGEVYFRKETEPYVSIAAAGDPRGTVLEAEVDLKHIWDVVAQARLVPAGVAYVVDRSGHLISHPDIGLVLRKTDLSALPHVRQALNRSTEGVSVLGEARNKEGLAVVSTAAPIADLGWTVFAEQPLEEAFRPVYASIARSVALVLLGIVAAVAASLLLARRMVRPIREIETRARELGEGRFDRRIEVNTDDELAALATQFNRMAAQIQETYAEQETRIAERTRDLALANEAKTRFLAAASHDLRQPIHALALFVGQLRGTKARDDANAVLEKIERSVEALQELLEGVLDLSRLDVGAISAVPRPLSLQDLLARLVAECAPSAEAKGLALTLVPTSLWIQSDPLLLQRILLNIISNALRYTVEGRVLIGCRRRGENVEVLVADTGIGIAAVHLPHVFQEFYRVAPAERGMDTGLGLGLAIVRRIVLLLGHRITIESVPGTGTIVRLVLLRAEPQERAIVPQASFTDSLRGVRVLIIDDEAPARDAMHGLLAQWGCDVATADNGDEAVVDARKRRPEVVLCDLGLAEGESGIEVVNRLRRELGPEVACAFVTGESAPECIAEARAVGHPIVFKPTTPGKLRAVLENLVQSRSGAGVVIESPGPPAPTTLAES